MRIGDEAGRVDQHMAGVDQGQDRLGEDLRRRDLRQARHGYAEADGPRQIAIGIDAANQTVRMVVHRVGEALVLALGDRTLAEIGAVAQVEDAFAVSGVGRETVLDALHRPQHAVAQGGHLECGGFDHDATDDG